MYHYVILQQRRVIDVFDDILWKHISYLSADFLSPPDARTTPSTVMTRCQFLFLQTDTFKVNHVLSGVGQISINFNQLENTRLKFGSMWTEKWIYAQTTKI